jgi:hypothetical protein
LLLAAHQASAAFPHERRPRPEQTLQGSPSGRPVLGLRNSVHALVDRFDAFQPGAEGHRLMGCIFERVRRRSGRQAHDQNCQQVTKFVSTCHGMSPLHLGLRSFAHFLFQPQGWHAACDA